MAAVLMFLKAEWKPILILVVLVSVLGYIRILQAERNHYEKKADQAVATLKAKEAEYKSREDAYFASAKSITAKYAQLDTKATKLEQENSKLLSERIAKNEELRNIKLSLNLVQLWNASKPSTTAPAAEAKPGHDAKASTPTTVTLADLFQVSKTNDENHLECIRIVEKWQKFWTDFEAGVEAAN